jgi:hypothetical protein
MPSPDESPDHLNLEEDWDHLRKDCINIPRMTDDQLREFIQGYLGGKYFTSENIRPEDKMLMLSLIFLPVALGAFSVYKPDSIREDLGILYEEYSKALPRSCNGYPSFFSVRIMHRLDWKKALQVIVAEEERRKTLVIPADEL